MPNEFASLKISFRKDYPIKVYGYGVEEYQTEILLTFDKGFILT